MEDGKCMGKRGERHERGGWGENLNHIAHVKGEVCRNSVIVHVIFSKSERRSKKQRSVFSMLHQNVCYFPSEATNFRIIRGAIAKAHLTELLFRGQLSKATG